MNVMKIVGLCVAAPFIAGISFAYYVGYKTTRWAFEHPGLAVSTIAVGGGLWYASHKNLGNGMTSFMQMYQDRRAALLEDKMRDMQHESLMRERALREQKTRADELEHRLEQRQPQASLAQPCYYYMKPNESLNDISLRITGAMDTLSDQNDPKLMPGSIIKIPQSFCRNSSEVHEHLEELPHFVIPDELPLSVIFEKHYREVIDLNRALGLPYSDRSTHHDGSRIVYYKKNLI